MAQEKAIHYMSSSASHDARAYDANYGAHREGMTPQDVADYYTRWAQSGGYEKDLCPERYRGPLIAAENICQTFTENRKDVKILDVACGTGYLAEELFKKGYRDIDGVDPAEGMIIAARKKGVYRNLYCEFLNEKQLPIQNDTYDLTAVAGGMGEGHIPCCALREMIRITKPGGHILIVMREEYLSYVQEYKDRLEPLMQHLEEEGKWKAICRKIVPNYSFDNNGVVFQFQLCEI